MEDKVSELMRLSRGRVMRGGEMGKEGMVKGGRGGGRKGEGGSWRRKGFLFCCWSW